MWPCVTYKHRSFTWLDRTNVLMVENRSHLLLQKFFKVYIIFRRSLDNHNKNDSYNTNEKVPIICMSPCTKIDQSPQQHIHMKC